MVDLVDAYDGSTCRLLRDLGDHLRLSLADVDDEHVGDHGSFRTDWIGTLLDKAAVPGGEPLDRYRVPCSAASATAGAGSCPSS
jgi:hypothetical protein